MTVFDMVWLVARFAVYATIAGTAIVVVGGSAFTAGWCDRVAGRPLAEHDPDCIDTYLERETRR